MAALLAALDAARLRGDPAHVSRLRGSGAVQPDEGRRNALYELPVTVG